MSSDSGLGIADVGRGWQRSHMEYRWSPPEHPDVTLDEPYGLGPEHIEGPATRLQTPRPVWAWVWFQHAGLLRVKGFAVASTPVAALVQVTWQGRLQHCWVWRSAVKNRTLIKGRRAPEVGAFPERTS